MEPYLRALVPGAGLAVNVAVQVLAVRLRGGRGLLRSLLEGFLAGLAAVAALDGPAVAAGPDQVEALALAAADLIACGLLGYCYFNFVNLGVTARRPRILIELREAPAGLTYAGLLERYNADFMVTARLERLAAGGQVVLRDGRYRAGSPLILFVARVIAVLRRVVLGRKGA